jgi:hypothetical protein
LAADLEKKKARGEQGMIDPFRAHRKRSMADHIADWIVELRQTGCGEVNIGQCEFRMGRIAKECGWKTLDTVGVESFIRIAAEFLEQHCRRPDDDGENRWDLSKATRPMLLKFLAQHPLLDAMA